MFNKYILKYREKNSQSFSWRENHCNLLQLPLNGKWDKNQSTDDDSIKIWMFSLPLHFTEPNWKIKSEIIPTFGLQHLDRIINCITVKIYRNSEISIFLEYRILLRPLNDTDIGQSPTDDQLSFPFIHKTWT